MADPRNSCGDQQVADIVQVHDTDRSFPLSLPPPVVHQSARALMTATRWSLFPPPPTVPSSLNPIIARRRFNSLIPWIGLSLTIKTNADSLSWCVPDCKICEMKAASDDDPARERGERSSRRALAFERKPCSLNGWIGSRGWAGGARSGKSDVQTGAAGTSYSFREPDEAMHEKDIPWHACYQHLW